MSDDKRNTSGQDRKRINVHQGHEIRAWSKKFGVTPDRLKEAVAAVGDQAEKVETYLNGERDAEDSEGRVGAALRQEAAGDAS
jgi:hypothetical protein